MYTSVWVLSKGLGKFFWALLDGYHTGTWLFECMSCLHKTTTGHMGAAARQDLVARPLRFIISINK